MRQRENECNIHIMNKDRIFEDILKENVFFPHTKLDDPIYRICNYDYIKNEFINKRINLRKVLEWDDPYENIVLRSRCIIFNKEEVSLKTLVASWFGLSWSKIPESDALWRIYSPNKNGIQLKTTPRKLLSTLINLNPNKFITFRIYMGYMNYFSKDEIRNFINEISIEGLASYASNLNFAKSLFIKRDTFKHEDEVRIIIDHKIDNDVYGDIVLDENKTFLNLQCNWNEIIDSITLDPRIDDIETSKKKSELSELFPNVQISRSSLYENPSYTISFYKKND